jgi:hypothetical protein
MLPAVAIPRSSDETHGLAMRHAGKKCLPTRTCDLYQDSIMTGGGGRRRPQWRRERKPILIRLLLQLAEQLALVAASSSESLSDAAERLIAGALEISRDGAA